MRNSPIKSVLIVNLKSLPTWHIDLADGFSQLGVSARTFITTPQTLSERFEKSVRGTKWFRSPTVSQRLVDVCSTFKPDLIIFLGMFVLPRMTVEALTAQLSYKPLLCAWVCDCFRAPQFEDWTLAEHVFYFDTFMEGVLPRYYADATTTTFLPLAANPERYRPLGLDELDDRLIFVGNVSSNRAEWLAAIEHSIAVEKFGPNSGRNRLNHRKKLTSEAINKLYNRHRMVLNINQSPNTENGANLRVFEVAAAGSVLLTQTNLDLARHYEPGVEVLEYASPASLIETYREQIADRKKCARIAAAGLRRTRAEHTFVHRAEQMLAALK